MGQLNPNAPAFVPHPTSSATTQGASKGPTTQGARARKHKHGHKHAPPAAMNLSAYGFYEAPIDSLEDQVNEEDLAELEACESWVRTMAELEEMEREHVVAMALSLAPKEALDEIERRAHADLAGTSPPRGSGFMSKAARKPRTSRG